VTKEELLNITLKQLNESLRVSPECFHLEDPESGLSPGLSNNSFTGPTIIWKYRVELAGRVVPDPNNAARTIIMTYSPALKSLSCHIYFREVNGINSAMMADAQISVLYDFPSFNESYRRFMKLKKKLVQRKRDKESMEYLKKLNSIFPTTFDDDLLK
jgi:hypothetical protein